MYTIIIKIYITNKKLIIKYSNGFLKILKSHIDILKDFFFKLWAKRSIFVVLKLLTCLKRFIEIQ